MIHQLNSLYPVRYTAFALCVFGLLLSLFALAVFGVGLHLAAVAAVFAALSALACTTCGRRATPSCATTP